MLKAQAYLAILSLKKRSRLPLTPLKSESALA